MSLYTQDIIDRRVGTGFVPLGEEPGIPTDFPLARWNAQNERYFRYWQHWSGEKWNETIPNLKDEEGRDVLRWPLQVNFLAVAAKKHAAAVIGEAPDTISPAIPARIRPKPRANDTQIDQQSMIEAKTLEYFINDVWDENAGKALQAEAVLLSQFLGGIILGARYAPDDPELENHLRIEYVLPDFFLPVWDTGHPDNLLEAWVVWRMQDREAELKFNLPSDDGQTQTGGRLYVEHWTKDKINITVGGKPVSYLGVDYDNAPNPFGVVPFVYIPRKRAGSYYGLSLVDDIAGLEEELNSRIADLGDIIHDASQPDLYARNLPNRAVTTVDLHRGRKAINLGAPPPGDKNQPEVFAVDPPKLPEGMTGFPGVIQKLMEHVGATPAITFGEDSGSQRSGTTLLTRFWSITSEATAQRINWDVGLARFNKILTKMAYTIGEGEITEQMTKGKQWRNNWAAMLPKDREQMLNEGVLLASEHAIHPATLAERMDWVEDPHSEYEKAMEHYKEQMDIEAEAMAASKPDPATKIKTPTAKAGSDTSN